MAPKPVLIDFRPISYFSRGRFKKFDCGNADLNNYVSRGLAHKNHKSNLSPCHVMVPRNKDKPLIGYLTLSNSSVEKGDPPPPVLQELPDYPIPVTLIGRLAISKEQQGKGFGKRALMHVFFTQNRSVRELHLGSVGVIADAVDQEAVDFYSNYDFELLSSEGDFPKRMFISNSTIFDAIDNP